MAQFYTNVDRSKNSILVRGYKDGKRFAERVAYKPYLFIDSKTPTKFKTLQGKYVEKKQFDKVSEAREFHHKYQHVSGFNIYGLTSWPLS